MKKQFAKKFLGISILSVITLFIVSSFPFNVSAESTSLTFEAESDYNISECTVANHSGCSGGKYVANVGPGNILQYNNIYVEADGVYPVTIYYFSLENRYGYLSVNSEAATTVNFTGLGNWSTIGSKTISVNLKAGNNTLKFFNSSAYMPDFDRIVIQGAIYQSVSSYEAEASGNIIEGTVANHDHCSDGKFVALIGSGKKLQINNIYAPSAGMYNIAIYYFSGEDRSGYVSVNNENKIPVTFKSIGNWQELGVKYISIYLKSGYNSIKFYNNSAYMPDFDRVCVVGQGYLLDNGKLEEINGSFPDSWSKGNDYAGKSVFKWESGTGMNGSKCLSISSAAATDAYWMQKVRLEPGKNYILKGYIKGVNITPKYNNVKIGANLSIIGDFCYSGEGTQTLGTFDWKEFSVDFQVPESGEVTVGCRLGNWWNEVSGTVMFDNLTIIPDDSLSRIDGTNIYLNLEKTDLTAMTSVNRTNWISKLDSAYNFYADLVGSKPFKGKKIGILSTHYYPGGWAVAGNPIKWLQPYVKSELTDINNNNVWSFGILHEIGHDFDIDGWNFDGEFWANTKMYFLVEALNAKVNTSYTGAGLAECYRNDFNDSYTKTIATLTRYHHDALTYCFIRIKNRIGLEPFKQTFRDFIATGENPSTNLAKFNRFLELLQKNYNPGGNEVISTFPSGELDFIRRSI